AEGVTVRTLRESLTRTVRTLMLVLVSAVVFVLLIACVNLASANLARGESQQREIAVRASLGASRARLVRQLATEKIVLCVGAGLLVRSFKTLMAENPGYRIQRIVLANVALPSARYANPNAGYGDTLAIERFYSGVLNRLRPTSGVDAVSLVNQAPLGGGGPG